MKNEELLREITLRFQAVAEGMSDEIRVVAEGHTMLAEKVDALGVRLEGVESGLDRLGVAVVGLRTEMRAGDTALRDEIRAGDTALREEIRAGDTALREEMRAGDTALREEIRAGDTALREEIRAGDRELREEISTLRAEVRAGDQALHEELSGFRAEVKGELAEVRRVGRLETTLGDLAARVDRLEGRSAG